MQRPRDIVLERVYHCHHDSDPRVNDGAVQVQKRSGDYSRHATLHVAMALTARITKTIRDVISSNLVGCRN